jgi:Tfp pilus assembly pilus retraction ATPase PilT
MEYAKLVGMIPIDKRDMLSDKLIDFILTSKNDEKMPSQLANTLLHFWQQNLVKTENGLAVLLEAALLLEPEKTVNIFGELQMANIAEKIKGASF